jgi:Calcineurin-like phosphoesterase
MRQHADELGVDLLLVDTGDRVDGNGLYDGSSPKGEYTYDIFKMQHIDVLCTGNHELYERDAAEREFTKTVPNFKGNYVASNLDILDPNTGNRVPLAPRYRKFTTQNQGIRVVAFGFLFDFTGNANNTFVQPVEDTVQEAWFQEAIREDVDIFVVIGHVDLRAQEFKAIYTSIRKQNWNTPIQFFGGHSHIRNFVKYDSKAYALESGRYMETIGWLSIDGIHNDGKEGSAGMADANANMAFNRRYIDNNLFGYHYHTGLNESTFSTELGRNVTKAIQDARKEMNLDEKFGCAPQDYLLNRAEYPSNSSILSWLDQQVLPDILVEENRSDVPRLAIINSGAVRFDIFQGPFTKDTIYIVSPFKNRFKYIKDVPYSAAKKVIGLLNSGGPVFESAGLQTWALTTPQQMAIHEDIVERKYSEIYSDSAQAPLHSDSSHKPSLIPGYTTSDDAGDDGDDTIHSSVPFYRIPNCVQAEIQFPKNGDPEMVDMVYLDFVEPWILLALRSFGQQYSSGDTSPYIKDHTMSELLEGWVKEHWLSDC